jgi:hypothetical protein
VTLNRVRLDAVANGATVDSDLNFVEMVARASVRENLIATQVGLAPNGVFRKDALSTCVAASMSTSSPRAHFNYN